MSNRRSKTKLPVPAETIAYVHHLYDHKELIEVHSQLYLYEVFRHFEADFVEKGIGDLQRSRWPQLLQDLDLLPEDYKTANVDEDRLLLSNVWKSWQNSSEAYRRLQVALPLDSQVQIPPQLVCLFRGITGFMAETSTILYRAVVNAAQCMAYNEYDIFSDGRINNLDTAPRKKHRILAFFGMTVFDKFLDAVEEKTRTPLVTQIPRTYLLDAAPVQPRQLDPGPVIGYQILDSMKEPIYSGDIRDWSDDGFELEEGGEAGLLVDPIDRPGTLVGGGVGSNFAEDDH